MRLVALSCVAALAIVAVGCSKAEGDPSGTGGAQAGAGGNPSPGGAGAGGAKAGAGGSLSPGDGGAKAGAGGGPSLGDTDAGTDGPAGTAWPFEGRRSYIVTSTLTPVGGAASAGPGMHSFTLVIDADTSTAIVGSTRASFAATSAGVLRFQGQISLGDFSSGWQVLYADGLTVVLGANGTLTGTGQGTGTTFIEDTGRSAPVTASLVGVPDTVAPSLAVTADGPADDPFSALTVRASEALPTDAVPRLLRDDGSELPFKPVTSNGDFVISYSDPGVFRWYGRTYTVSVGGIADFAGHAAQATGTTSLTTRPAPPLVPEDGFESATGTLGGAQILAGGAPPTITGAISLYIPPIGNGPFSGPRPRSTRLALRLAVAPGDTVVRFAYRLVNGNNASGVSFVLATKGGRLAAKSISSDGTDPQTTAKLPDGTQVQVGPVATFEFPLPADVGNEVVFTEQVTGYGGGLPPPPVAGFILDDLRVE